MVALGVSAAAPRQVKIRTREKEIVLEIVFIAFN
jgi:hypothetical protein